MRSSNVRRPIMDVHNRLTNGKILPPAHWRHDPQASMWKPIPGTYDGSAGTPSIHANSANIVAKLAGWGNPSQILIGQDSSSAMTFPPFTHPTYFAKPDDPVFEIRKTTAGFTNPWWTTTTGPLVKCPQSAKPSSGGDAHFAVVQPDGTEWFVYDLASDLAGTTLTALPGGGGIIYGKGMAKHNIMGDGIRIGASGSGTAACVSSMFGEILPSEAYARRINHALFMVIRSTDGTWTHPAQDAAASTDPTNAPPNGARFQLNMTQTAIDAIADTSNATGRWWNKMVLTALREFGMFVCDTSSANWAVQTWGAGQYHQTGTDPWRTWAASTSPAMTYNATDDIYLWDIRTVVTWSANLRVLDWTDAANH